MRYFMYNLEDGTIKEIHDYKSSKYRWVYRQLISVLEDDDIEPSGTVAVTDGYAFIATMADAYSIDVVLNHEIGHAITGHDQDGEWRHGDEFQADAHAVDVVGKERVLKVLHDLQQQLRWRNKYIRYADYSRMIDKIGERIKRIEAA